MSIIKANSDADRERVRKLYFFEDQAHSEGYNLIAGVDEAGRGSLVGEMTVAAVILPKNLYLPKLNDSKKISAHIREELYNLIVENAISWRCELVGIEEIDSKNIYQATLSGMKRAVENLSVQPDCVLTDAMKLDFGDKIFSRSIVHGDALSASIAAASIIAKVTRDKMADEWSKKFPEYGFEKNRGYGTKFHLDAIKNFGPSLIHRKSFNPVKSMIEDGKMENNNSSFLTPNS